MQGVPHLARTGEYISAHVLSDRRQQGRNGRCPLLQGQASMSCRCQGRSQRPRSPIIIMPFASALLITLSYWTLVLSVSAFIMYSVRYIYKTRWFRKLAWYSLLTGGAILIFLFSIADTESQAMKLIPLVAGIFLLPFALLALLQICFWAYHTVMHGNPFYEPFLGSEKRVIFINETPKRVKKMCPICKRPTRCRVSRSIGLGSWIHVQRD